MLVTKRGAYIVATSLSDRSYHILTMRHISAKEEAFQQTSARIRESVYHLAKKESISLSEAAEQSLIAALRTRGVEV